MSHLSECSFLFSGGSSQPGCGVDLVGTCAHGRAYEFFSESLKVNNGFVANRCLTYNEVKNKRCTIQSSGHLMGGEPPNNNLRGIFLLATNSQAPFAKFWIENNLMNSFFDWQEHFYQIYFLHNCSLHLNIISSSFNNKLQIFFDSKIELIHY